MIYFFYGPDIETSRKKARALFESLKVKKPDASFGELVAEGITSDKIIELVGGQGLFSNKSVVFCDNIFSDMVGAERTVAVYCYSIPNPNSGTTTFGKYTKTIGRQSPFKE